MYPLPRLIARSALVLAAMLGLGQAAIAQGVLKVSAIPDEAPTELQRKFKPLGEYLEKETGMKVEFTPVTDYAAVVESLATRKIDMAWLGGFTFVQTRMRTNGTAIPIVQRAGGRDVHQQVHQCRPTAIKSLRRPQGQDLRLRFAVLHLRAPDAALLPAAGRARSGQGFQERRLLRRP